MLLSIVNGGCFLQLKRWLALNLGTADIHAYDLRKQKSAKKYGRLHLNVFAKEER